MIDLLEERRSAHAKQLGLPRIRLDGKVYVTIQRVGDVCPVCKSAEAALCTDSWHLPRFLGDPRVAAAKRACERRGSH